MFETILLDQCAYYSDERVKGSNILKSEFVSTDSLLQNKCGVANPVSLPSGNLISFNKDDILIGNIRPYLKKIWFSNRKGGCSPDVLVFRAKSNINSKFLYYTLFRDDFFNHMMNGAKGTKMPRGDKKQIMRFEIPLFDLSNQLKISSVLSILDSKIEINKQINAELEKMAKTIYDYWFVQFDFPDENGKPYKSSGGKMVWSKELKREIPEGWKVGKLGDIADLIRGVTYSSSDIKNEFDEDVIPILRATNISANVIDLNSLVYVPKEHVSKDQLLNKYDILITMSSGSIDHIGKNGFYYFDKEVAFGAFCAKIKAKKNYKFYLYSYTQSDFLRNTIKNECLGTNINNLNGGLVNAFKLVKPHKELVDLFNEKVSTIYKKIENNTIENQQLTSLRDWLLPMLMNGQVTVN